ncbi:MAG TPA: alkaline phosphatase family protein [Candidatus Limnocylindrales bacterium]|nr:alkaline phosphatase family protein [Candidatus Limnocylindrales bacterium]
MLLIVGWDGAAWPLADRFMAAGAMPTLAALAERGRTFDVESTVPPVTFPAWTTFMTAAGPGMHGITDFTARRAGSYGVKFLNSTHRRLPTIWRQMAAAGCRVGVYAMPATYPAERVCEIEVCGFDTPLGASQARGFCHPPSLADTIVARHGALAVEAVPQTRIGPGWHERTLERLLANVALRTRIVSELLRERSFDVFAVHYMESDTVAHHFWQFHDESSPRHRGEGPAAAIEEVYRALDRGLAELMAAAGDDCTVLLLSDHGCGGASDRAIAWNRVLADAGFLSFARVAAGARLAGALRRTALSAVPQPWQAPLLGAMPRLAARLESAWRLTGIDWSATSAYSEELPYHPSIWLNLAGREPAGIVAPHEAEHVIGRLSQALLALRDPFDGGAVVRRVRRREEVCAGPYAHQVPDLVLELREPDGYSYCAIASRGGQERAWLRRLRSGETSGAKGNATSGMHRPTGIGLLCGPPISAASSRERCTLADCGVTALAMAGVAPSPFMEGRALAQPGSTLESGQAWEDCAADVAYSAEEEREVEQRLRALGYLP